MPAKLREVLATFGFSEILISASAQCLPGQCLPARSHLKFEYLRENEFLRENILNLFMRGPDWLE